LDHSGVLRVLVCSLFTSCLHRSTFPTAWKSSIIVPLVKDESKERSCSNVRPISLQSCLGKLFMKVLAHRVARTLTRFPILNPAQRGFVQGGCISKCIDELLDAWDHGRLVGSELHTLFYDIKQAYDSVQREVLVRAMRRLRMPASFVALVADSLTGLASRVRTAFGVSASFDVERSLRQGCPLAPLLFVILMDALHDGLEVNPFTDTRHGLVLRLPGGGEEYLPSLGYADDTTINAGSLEDLRVLNDWVHLFMRFNKMRLNGAKSELVGRCADGSPVTAGAVAAAGITIDGQAIEPLAHDKPIRYLGVHCCFDNSWSAQHAKSNAMVHLFARVVAKFRLSVAQAAYLFNAFLLPKLEHGLRYLHGPHASDWVKSYDRVLVGSIKHVVQSPLQLSHTAVALAAGFTLPSWLEAAIKTSELFIRMNSTGCRWSRLGRTLMRSQVGTLVQPLASMDARSQQPRPSAGGSRLARATHLASGDRLQWSLSLGAEHTAASRRQHLFQRAPAEASPPLHVCQQVQLAGAQVRLTHDCWWGWGAGTAPVDVRVYTDGSYDAHSLPVTTSSWAVTVQDEWLQDNFASVPVDEDSLDAAEVGGACMIGASIRCTSGVYAAELQAIARVLAMFPLSATLRIHSDSRGALAGIAGYERSCNERKRLRMSARPLLQLIHHLLQARARAHGSVHWAHVKAHTTHADIHSVGNRLTDYQANIARLHPARTQPALLQELPLAECEHHLVVRQQDGQMLIDDVRRAARVQLRAAALTRWSSKIDTSTLQNGFLAGDGMLALSRAVMLQGTREQQKWLVHIATNSIHCRWVNTAAGDRVEPVLCTHCSGAACTIAHMTECDSAAAAQFRAELLCSLRRILATSSDTAAWLRSTSALDLRTLLFRLFPLARDALLDLPQRHFARLLCGAFTSSQATCAAKAVGFSDAQTAAPVFAALRLTCIDHLAHHFARIR